MTKRMLIDATHDEETRVAVVDDGNNRLLEFDYENKARKPLKGSIFLAKVTRVEPSLQAAFVNFGGNRHGFLPFSEIHPDYYRIPVSDREALIEEQEALLAEEEEKREAEEEKGEAQVDEVEDADIDEDDDDLDEIEEINADSERADDEEAELKEPEEEKKPKRRGRKSAKSKTVEKVADEEEIQADDDEEDVKSNKSEDNASDDESEDDEDDNIGNRKEDDAESDDDVDEKNNGNRRRRYNNRRGGRGGRGRGRGRGRHKQAAHSSRHVEVLGGTEYEDDESGSDRFRFNLRRQYKIQEVIKRGQIMLVQASREERGNKGAAVTTYLSLPGRYGVLMPNSPRSGGVSRKIAKYEDRQRMRKTLKELDVPKGMSVILRTAGVTRTKTEIKRDVDYLMRLWNDIRELTLQSSAPAMIYEEADLIKRAVRDLYTRDVEEIQVAGDDGQKTAKKFMKMMIPSHVKKVKEYKDEKIPLFHKYGVENQISEMSETTARLKSGGYLVINPTEALVSIDVNSGRATKERHIEETALNTNLEAAEELARQLRLRDLGGLVVVDFIDMEDRRNNAKVERKLKEALSQDRARIQIGRISSFGLLEMSRQRLNPSLTEAQFDVCKHCEGRGVVRNCDSTSILLLRGLEDEGIKGRAAQLIVHVSNEVALYILNNKRAHLEEIEQRYGFTVLIRSDDTMGADRFRIEVSKPAEGYVPGNESKNDNNDDDERGGKGNRRRGRRGGRGRNKNNDRSQNDDQNQSSDMDDQNNAPDDDKQAQSDEKPKRGRRKASAKKDEQVDDPKNDVKQDAQSGDKSEEKSDDKPKSTRKKKEDGANVDDKAKKSDDKAEVKEEKPKKKTAAKSTTRKKKVEDKTESVDDVKVIAASNDTKPTEEKPNPAAEHETVNEAPKKKKRGWWSKGD